MPSLATILHLLLAVTQLANAFDCTKKFWPNLTPSESNTVAGNCRYVKGYPRTLGTTKVSVAYTVTGREYAKSHNVLERVKPVLSDSLSKSIKEYSSYAKIPGTIVIILTDEVQTYYFDTWYPVEKQPPCQIKGTRSFLDLVTSNPAWARQALAHEMYHCVQSLAIGPSVAEPIPSSLWVIEGSANYFSNVVFPKANVEWPSALGGGREYDPSRPIYAQDGIHAYGTSVYFQSLESVKGKKALSNWVLTTKQTDNGPDERTRLSRLAGFADSFFTFAKRYALNNIIDTSGVKIPGLEALVSKQVSLSSGNAVTLDTTPFTLQEFQLRLKPGHTYRLSAPTGANQRLAWRLSTDTAWKKLTVPIVIPCTGTGDVLLLFTSTKDSSRDSISVAVRQSKKRQTSESCPIGGSGFVLWPLQDAQGSAVCPVGTHTTTLAAWCCPDGSNLDEAHADQASICCPGTTDCYDEIIAGLKCANSNWVLWSKNFQQVGCCQKGFVPTSLRYCVTDKAQLGAGYSTVGGCC